MDINSCPKYVSETEYNNVVQFTATFHLVSAPLLACFYVSCCFQNRHDGETEKGRNHLYPATLKLDLVTMQLLAKLWLSLPIVLLMLMLVLAT